MTAATTDDRTPTLRARRLLVAVGAWLGMLPVAIGNAGIRETLVTPRLGEYPGHVISTGSLLALLAGYVAGYFRRVRGHTGVELAAIGLVWSGLTVAFELLFGHYVAGDPWDSLVEQYDVRRGRVWILIPLFLLVAPWHFGRSQSGG